MVHSLMQLPQSVMRMTTPPMSLLMQTVLILTLKAMLPMTLLPMTPILTPILTQIQMMLMIPTLLPPMQMMIILKT